MNNTDNRITIKIPNFKLNVFRNLLEQSLIVDNQLMLEFSPDILKSCSFSVTKSFLKLWTIPLQNLLLSDEEKSDDIEQLEIIPKEKKQKLDFPVFNFYILKGDLFNKYLSVNNSDTVDLEFILHKIGNKYQAANVTIKAENVNKSILITNFVLNTEDLITNKIQDYSDIIKECTPSKTMFDFNLTNLQIQEVKRLIKQLHKSSADNVAFLTFNIDLTTNKVIISDKVFNISFDLLLNEKTKNLLTKSFSFNILKADFLMTGNHTFSIFTSEVEHKVIFGGNFSGSIIWCLSSKISDTNINLDNNIMDSTMDNIESLDVSEYL